MTLENAVLNNYIMSHCLENKYSFIQETMISHLLNNLTFKQDQYDIVEGLTELSRNRDVQGKLEVLFYFGMIQ